MTQINVIYRAPEWASRGHLSLMEIWWKSSKLHACSDQRPTGFKGTFRNRVGRWSGFIYSQIPSRTAGAPRLARSSAVNGLVSRSLESCVSHEVGLYHPAFSPWGGLQRCGPCSDRSGNILASRHQFALIALKTPTQWHKDMLEGEESRFVPHCGSVPPRLNPTY